jgi:hypothetical protein
MTAYDLYQKYCEGASRQGSITVFGVGFDQGMVGNEYSARHRTGSINITTTVKEAPGCRGNLRQRTCTLKLATVEYNVYLKNDTIALRSGASNLAKRASAATNASANATAPGFETKATTWRPAQDHVVALTPSYTTEVSIWSHFFSLLYEPVQVNLTAGLQIYFDRFIDCVPDTSETLMTSYYSNTSCPLDRRIPRHDLAQEYAVEPYNYSQTMDNYSQTMDNDQDIWAYINAQCGVYWLDPMQVCDAANVLFTITQNSSFECPVPFSNRHHLLCLKSRIMFSLFLPLPALISLTDYSLVSLMYSFYKLHATQLAPIFRLSKPQADAGASTIGPPQRNARACLSHELACSQPGHSVEPHANSRT